MKNHDFYSDYDSPTSPILTVIAVIFFFAFFFGLTGCEKEEDIVMVDSYAKIRADNQALVDKWGLSASFSQVDNNNDTLLVVTENVSVSGDVSDVDPIFKSVEYFDVVSGNKPRLIITNSDKKIGNSFAEDVEIGEYSFDQIVGVLTIKFISINAEEVTIRWVLDRGSSNGSSWNE